jgi:hypothetical protein
VNTRSLVRTWAREVNNNRLVRRWKEGKKERKMEVNTSSLVKRWKVNKEERTREVNTNSLVRR